MQKLSFILLLTASYSFSSPLKQKPAYFKKIDNQWKFCREINEKDAGCVNIDTWAKEMQAIIQLLVKNKNEADLVVQNKEKASDQLLQNIAIATIRYAYHLLQIENEFLNSNNNYQIEPNLSKKEQNAGRIQLITEASDNSSINKDFTCNNLPEWQAILNDPELLSSILPEEERKMLHALAGMNQDTNK